MVHEDKRKDAPFFTLQTKVSDQSVEFLQLTPTRHSFEEMAHPVVWMRKAWFFPTGNWPSVCLTQELSPEENAEILLLGCGDPRSILFTIYHDLAPDYRHLDITCCDWEPAVIARNIILFTMVADGVSPDTVWSIFFHTFLDQMEYHSLLAHCRTLVQCSSDLEAWKASKYGGYIRFCTEWSFAEVRRHWLKYLEFDTLPDNEKQAIQASFEAGMKTVQQKLKDGMILNSLRSAGPLFMYFEQFEAAKTYSTYWTTGTTASATVPPYSNPTFFYSLCGNFFAVYHGTEPLPGFHLAPALIPIKGVHSSPDPDFQDVAKTAMDQFRLWCSAFKKRVGTGFGANLKLRFHVGEGMAFCRALLVCQRTKSMQSGVYTSQWGGTQITLDESDYSGNRPSAPLAFNVIDTSNFTDHLGLFNILTATVPLLQKKPWAVLHTDTLVPLHPNGSPSSTLADHAGDIPTLSLAFGVAPSSFLSHFTTYSNKHELIAASLSMCSHTRDRISWRIPTPVVSGSVGDKLAEDLQRPTIQKWQAKDLARYFFSVYLKIFDDESISSLRNMNPASFKKRSLSQYTREGLVAFMALVKERVKADWIAVVEAFDDLQAADHTLLLGNTHYQDFVCQLYLYDVYVMDSMNPAFLESLRGRNNLFRGWKDIPPVVCAVLKVPRDRLKILEEMSPDAVGTPILQCETRGAQFHNIHSSLRPIFGDLVLSSIAGELSVSINEDLRGWDGNSDLIVTFYLPSWTLLRNPPDAIEIGLIFKSTPYAVATLASKLGRHLCIYSTKLSNSANVLLVRHRPDNIEEIRNFRVNSASPSEEVGQTVMVNVNPSLPKVSTLTIRDDITHPATKKSLSHGASVNTQAIADTAIRVCVKNYVQTLVYPFPIRTDQLKVRIARKSSYVEVEAPIRSDLEDARKLSLNLFPVARDGKIINLLNIHYVNLDTLPALELPQGENMGWLTSHLGMTMSESEKQAAKSQDQTQRGMFFNLKESIALIFNEHMTLEERPFVFALHNPEDNTGIYTYIFINEIRLDLSAQTIVADACVVPFYFNMLFNVLGALKTINSSPINTLNDEMAAWKKLLPAFAERCRTWKHTDNCEYLEKGIPAITEYDMFSASPLCSCGRGKNLGSFANVESWKPFAPYATRVAIALLFTFSNGDLAQTMRPAALNRANSGPRTTPSTSPSNVANCANFQTTLRFSPKQCLLPDTTLEHTLRTLSEMAHPLVWPKKHFFYPIGNTPPICLTQELSPEESAEILLLGCGDPRSIMFTVWNDLSPNYRKLDVTCCDWEPAVLARNVILLTMAADGVSTAAAWSIFYHFFLDQNEYDILVVHCRKLVQCSSDLSTWKTSKYGGYIRFCTEQSFSEVRRHWVLYLESKNLPDVEKNDIRATFASGMKVVQNQYRENRVLTCLRSAGPLVMSFVHEAAKSHNAFWSTGTTRSDPHSAATLSHTNPTFLYSLSGKRFAVHYGTDPLSAFHLSPGLIPIKGVHSPPKPNLQDLVKTAMSQFELWCLAFKKRVSTSSTANLKIRIHVGESMAFCRALLVCQKSKSIKSGVYTSPWGGSRIVLDDSDYSGGPSSAPAIFNVIDTSNLTDHLGLLNTLTVTVPLLQRKPWAVIHTNTLVPLDPDNRINSNLSSRVFADIPTLSLVLGVTPSPCRSHFTTQSNKHEILASPLSHSQLHEYISWKIPPSIISGSVGDDVAADIQRPTIQEWQAKDLGRFFFAVYSKMFDDENISSAVQNMTLAGLNSRSLSHYTRESLVSLLVLVKERVKADWIEIIETFDDLQAADHSLLVGSNNYQDFVCHLYLRGVYTMDSMKPAFLDGLRGRNNLFRGWRDIPPVVCAVLKVPRDRLKVLEDMDADKIMTPLLQCETRGSQFHNIHASIRPIFGNMVSSSVGGEPSITINEDMRGWDGNSDLIVTFYMPSWILLQHAPDTVEIGLAVKSTPMSVNALVSKLGMLLNIYSAKVSNSASVQFVRHRPNNLEEIRHLQVKTIYASPENRKKVVVNFDASEPKVSTLTIRHDISHPVAKMTLLQGASVVTKPIADSVIRVTIQDYAHTLVYPFPVRVDQTKVRIARKSSYVEIEAPVRPDFEDHEILSLNLFPVARDGKIVNLLNIHYVNLDKLPALQLPKGVAMHSNWMSVHLGMTMSDSEKQAGKLLDQDRRGMLYNLKESIGTIFLKHTEMDERPRVFGLHNPGDDVGIYTLVFLNDIKLDLSAQTIMADACVVPLYEAMIPRIMNALGSLSPIAIVTLEDETLAWKRLLPAFAERCRTWKHSDNCEYLKKGFPVALIGYASSPLCSCGKGKNLGSFSKVPSWKLFQPEAIRIAIGPLFTFSNMYDMLQSLKKNMDTGKSNGRTTQSSSSGPASMNCANCAKSGAAHMCSNCKTVRYCSSSCQKNHWKAHKPRCISKS
ncbi:hypothetical protein CVT25_003903 [Psilocybe cyanescens]|uniref:MYND-type domain-containing protein n=1 Tax=Psilocybe cyanescens TaxID=93625 RepID=A0A409XPS7_PSICY|nr:hypothetical protein CVT25_003903 [Psilocybe cyanescens]